MTDEILEVYEGEANEDITINTKVKNQAYDPQWATWATAGGADSKLEIKTTSRTLVETLEFTDYVSDTVSSIDMKIDKLGALSKGTYLAFLHLKDGAGRVKIFKYHLKVRGT